MNYISNLHEIKEKVSIDTILKHFTSYEGGKQKIHCPFHDEKTPSFSVSTKKNIGTCFGACSRSWNPIDFIKEHEGISFIEAVEFAAKLEGIQVKYAENLSESQLQEIKQTLEKTQTCFYYNSIIIEQYFNNNHKELIKGEPTINQQVNLVNRSLSWDTIQTFDITFTSSKWTYISEFSKKLKLDLNLCQELGWIKLSDKGIFDTYQNRILFPIKNKRGEILGVTARATTKEAKAKYLNSPESLIYKKNQTLYGFYENQQTLRKTKQALLVEGTFDVVSLYDHKIQNAVATCGTALSKEQVDLLKNTVNEVTLVYDGDKAGVEAAKKNIPLLIKSGLKTSVVLLPDGEDPDSYIRAINKEAFEEYIQKNKTEAIFWTIQQIIQNKNDAYQIEEATNKACELLSLIESQPLREAILNTITSKTPINKRGLSKLVSENITALNDNTPKSELTDEQQSDLLRYGFYEDNNCYHTDTRILSNYVIKPLFHIKSKENPKRLFTLINIYGEATIMDIDTIDFASLDRFLIKAEAEGNYLFKGSNKDFLMIKCKVYDLMESCLELDRLGYNNKGFYAFSNGLQANGAFHPINETGIVDLEGIKYFLPAHSDLYKDKPEQFIDQRRIIYKPSEINFESWARVFHQVHGDNGKIAMLYYIASLFRDIIYKEFKFFPHLNFFGQPGTGKSYLAWSLSYMFGDAIPPFNLNSGTHVGFYNRFELAKNNLIWFDEYKNSIDPKRVEFLKGAYDGVGREKGQKSSKQSIKTVINSACVISGQELPTADNALFTRVILLEFSKSDRSQKEKERGRTLEEMQETHALGSITAKILDYRHIIEQRFRNTFEKVAQQLRERLKKNKLIKDRILSNISILIAILDILDEFLSFPFSKEEFLDVATKLIVRQSELISNADEVSTFWDMVDFMAAKYEITKNTDFVIESTDRIRVQERSKTKDKMLGDFKRVLFLSCNYSALMYSNKNRSNRIIGKQTGQSIKSIDFLFTSCHDITSNSGKEFCTI